MAQEEKNTKITISAFHGVKVTAELPWDATSSQIMEAVEGMLITLGYAEGWLKMFCEQYLEERGGAGNE